MSMSRKKYCVPGCLESGRSHQTLHLFPNPAKDRNRYNQWVQSIGGDIIGLENEDIYKHRSVCHAHFVEKFCCRYNKISNIAVPTLNLPGVLGTLSLPKFTFEERRPKRHIEKNLRPLSTSTSSAAPTTSVFSAAPSILVLSVAPSTLALSAALSTSTLSVAPSILSLTSDARDSNTLCHLPENSVSHQAASNMAPQTHMCRLCATVTEFVVPIFEGEGLQNCLADKIHQHLPIQVSQTDILPTVMCFQCTSTLLAWHELVVCAVQADTAMRERFNLHLSQSKEDKQQHFSTDEGQSKNEKDTEPEVKLEAEDLTDEATRDELARPREVTTGEDGKRYAVCGTCDRTVSATAWRRHARSHAGIRRYSCHACGKAFTDGGNLARHARDIHGDVKPFVCRICDRTFSRKSHLADHMRSHAGTREYLCDVCGAASKSAAALRMHKVTHGAPRHGCAHCGASFKRKSELHAHASVHTGERKHACACGKAFRLRAQLTAHSRTHAENERSDRTEGRSPRATVPCEFCARELPDSELRAHLLAAHAARLFLCAECDLYRNKDTMMLHMGMHIEADENEPKAPETVETEPAPKIVIPVVRIQRVPSKYPPPPPPETACPCLPPTPAPFPVKYPPPIVDNLTSSKKSEESKPVLLLLRAAQSVELNHNQNNAPPSYSESVRASELRLVGNTEPESQNDIPLCNEPAATGEVQSQPESLSKEITDTASPKGDEFSDHSDIENEFGRVPESVFDAIEDTEDGHSNEELDSIDSPIELPKSKTESKKSNKPHTCPVCGKTYSSTSSWYYHLKHGHVKEKQLACDSCSKVFASKERLAVHKRTHEDARPFACRVCGKGFSTSAGRYVHEQAHTERKEYSCSQCGRAFRWRTLLKRHEARHAKKGEFVCNVCGRGFSVGFDLIRHARRHEPGCHECDLCGSKFKQKRYLKVHMENKHFAQTARVANVEPNSRLDS